MFYPDPKDSAVYTRNFRFGFQGTRFAQGLFDSRPTGFEDRGSIEHTPDFPDMIELSSVRQWDDSISWVDLIFPARDGKLTDSTLGLGQEELLVEPPQGGAATLLVCAFDITRIAISTPVALGRSRAANGPRQKGWSDGNRERIFRSNHGMFSIDGRRK